MALNTCITAVLLLLLLLTSDAFVVVDIRRLLVPSSRTPTRTAPTARTAWYDGSDGGHRTTYSPYQAQWHEQSGLIPGVDPCEHGAPSCWVVPETTSVFDNVHHNESPATAADPEAATTPTREQQLEVEIEELRTQLLRSQQSEQEKTQRMLETLIDVSDNLSRALEAVPASEKERNDALKTLCEGIKMTERGLDKAFEIGGVRKYGEIGDLFDPTYHHALFELPDPEKEPGTVGHIMKAGYLLNSNEQQQRVLRYAEVAVVKSREDDD
jgi:molecular chaperone GrpE